MSGCRPRHPAKEIPCEIGKNIEPGFSEVYCHRPPASRLNVAADVRRL